MSSRSAVLATLCVLVALAPLRRAEAEDAKYYFDKATASFALNKYAEAAIAYEKAFELKPDPALLYDAAQAHRLAGNKPRALSLYQSYVRIYGRSVSNRAEVERHITELREAIAQDQKVASAPPTSTTAPQTNIESAPPRPAPTPEPSPAPAVVPEPAPSAVVATAPPPAREKPLVKKPWFWAVVGGGAVAVALGVGLGVGLTRSPSDPTPTFGQAAGN